MIEKILERMDGSTKSRWLGKQVVNWLRIAFAENNYVLDSKILDEIILDIASPRIWMNREDIIDLFREHELKELGFESYDDARSSYETDRIRFARDLNIPYEKLFPRSFDKEESHFRISPEFGKKLVSQGAPHDYQRIMKSELFEELSNIRSSILVTMPTGGGKTRLANEVLIDLFRTNKALSVIWLVDKKELLEQSISAFSRLWCEKGDKAILVRKYFGSHDSLDFSHSHIITYLGLDKVTPNLKKPRVQNLIRNCDVLVIDEVHKIEAFTYKEVLLEYRQLNRKYRDIGLTATPYRPDLELFSSIFNKTIRLRDLKKNVVDSPIEYLVKNKYLSQLNFETLSISKPIESEEGQKELFEECSKSIKALCELGSRCVIFALSMSHSVALHAYLKREGIRSELIIGSIKDEKRETIIKRLKNRELNVIVNHEILSTGLDIPGLEAIMILSNIQSPSLALQILGRAMRGEKNGGNSSNTVILTPENHARLSEFRILEQITLS